MSWTDVELRDRDPWAVADHGFESFRVLVVAIGADGVTGVGEAPEFRVLQYRSGMDDMRGHLDELVPWLERLDPVRPDLVWEELRARTNDHRFVMHAVDVALWDLWARLQRRSLRDVLGLGTPSQALTSYSIGLDKPDVMVAKLRARPHMPYYKIKAAGADDLEALHLIRQETNAPFYVDGNGAWSLKELRSSLTDLEELGVVLLEQPLPAAAWQDAGEIRSRTSMRLVADEAFTSEEDLEACAGSFSAVNVKLAKLGGVTPSVRAAAAAGERGLGVMLGCMPESSIGVSAAAQLASAADYLDLDSALLLEDDPARGVLVDAHGELRYAQEAGIGARLSDRLRARLGLTGR